jgi:hypothetical protein
VNPSSAKFQALSIKSTLPGILIGQNNNPSFSLPMTAANAKASIAAERLLKEQKQETFNSYQSISLANKYSITHSKKDNIPKEKNKYSTENLKQELVQGLDKIIESFFKTFLDVKKGDVYIAIIRSDDGNLSSEIVEYTDAQKQATHSTKKIEGTFQNTSHIGYFNKNDFNLTTPPRFAYQRLKTQIDTYFISKSHILVQFKQQKSVNNSSPQNLNRQVYHR